MLILADYGGREHLSAEIVPLRLHQCSVLSSLLVSFVSTRHVCSQRAGLAEFFGLNTTSWCPRGHRLKHKPDVYFGEGSDLVFLRVCFFGRLVKVTTVLPESKFQVRVKYNVSQQLAMLYPFDICAFPSWC